MSATTTTANAVALRSLRSLLRKHNISAYIIPTADAHQSEYVADQDKRREFISQFTGSAGTAIVTDEEALLWTVGVDVMLLLLYA